MAINTPQEILRTQIATHNATSPVGAEVMANQAGRNVRTSESVQVSPNQADISDALEELGMAAATRGKGDLEKMKVRKGQGADMEALSRIAEYYEKLPDLPSEEKHRELVLTLTQYQDLMEGGERGSGNTMPTAEDIRAALREYDGDVTHQFVALEDMRARAAAAGAPASFIALLDEVRSEMRQPETMRDITAGLSSAREAARVADRFGADPETYRESYRTLLREAPSLGRIFDEFRKFSLSDNFEDVIESFTKVAGDELHNTGPRTDPVVLNMLLTELSNLKGLRSVFDASGQMLSKIERMYPGAAETARPAREDVTSRLFHFAGAPVASMADAEGLVAGFESNPPELPVIAINLLRDLHSSLPDAIMHSPQAREQQSRLLMDLSDRLVDAEEAAYEMGSGSAAAS